MGRSLVGAPSEEIWTCPPCAKALGCVASSPAINPTVRTMTTRFILEFSFLLKPLATTRRIGLASMRNRGPACMTDHLAKSYVSPIAYEDSNRQNPTNVGEI